MHILGDEFHTMSIEIKTVDMWPDKKISDDGLQSLVQPITVI